MRTTTYHVTSYRVDATPGAVQLELDISGLPELIALRFTDDTGLAEFLTVLKAARLSAWHHVRRTEPDLASAS